MGIECERNEEYAMTMHCTTVQQQPSEGEPALYTPTSWRMNIGLRKSNMQP